jgi:hypothetical protein
VCVCTPAEAFLAMCTHALTTEAEEVMGLLLGDIRVRAGNTFIAPPSTQACPVTAHVHANRGSIDLDTPLLPLTPYRQTTATQWWPSFAEQFHKYAQTGARWVLDALLRRCEEQQLGVVPPVGRVAPTGCQITHAASGSRQ